jgi:hypothetical protein
MFEDDDSRRWAKYLPPVKAPDSVWAAIESSLKPTRGEPHKRPRQSLWGRPIGLVWGRRSVFAVCLAAALTMAVALWHHESNPHPRWDVVRLDGAPSIGSQRVAQAGTIAEGEWLQTDAGSRARIKVGAIGTVNVEPNTRLRVTAARANEHRLTLAHGDISASVSAPPRLFFVDTPASTAVDLGCAYTMHVDDSGFGLLRVTLGSVSLEWKGRESFVPAGASCRMHPHGGPGIPYFDDSTATLQQALEADLLDVVLAESRPRDTLTLWHLLSRAAPEDRARVLDRIVVLEPSLAIALPREQLLNLDRKELERLKEQLGRLWR